MAVGCKIFGYAALTELNGDGILLQRVEAEDTWKAWGDSLGNAYRDPESGTITCNHIFEFGKDDDKCRCDPLQVS